MKDGNAYVKLGFALIVSDSDISQKFVKKIVENNAMDDTMSFYTQIGENRTAVQKLASSFMADDSIFRTYDQCKT